MQIKKPKTNQLSTSLKPLPYLISGSVANHSNQTWLFNPLTASFVVLSPKEHQLFQHSPHQLPHKTQQQLLKNHFLYSPNHPPTFTIQKSNTLSVWLHLANTCNLRCPYCFVCKQQPDLVNPKTTTKHLDKIFTSAKKHGFTTIKLKYAGGEPTIPLTFQKLLQIHHQAIQLAKKYQLQLKASIITNGTLLTPTQITTIKKLHIHTAVSLDGWGKTHDLTRSFPSGQSSFSRVLQSIENLQANHNSFNLSVVVHRKNLTSLTKLVKYCFDRSRPISLKLNFVRDNPNSTQTMMPTIPVLISEMKQLISLATKLITKHHHSPLLLNGLLDYIDIMHPKNFACEVGRSYLTLKANGDISSCHMNLDKPLANLNQIDDPLAGITHNPDPPRLSVDQKPICKNCPIRYLCGGGCPILNYHTYGTFSHTSPYCPAYRTLTPYLISHIITIFNHQS